VKARGNGRRTL